MLRVTQSYHRKMRFAKSAKLILSLCSFYINLNAELSWSTKIPQIFFEVLFLSRATSFVLCQSLVRRSSCKVRVFPQKRNLFRSSKSHFPQKFLSSSIFNLEEWSGLDGTHFDDQWSFFLSLRSSKSSVGQYSDRLRICSHEILQSYHIPSLAKYSLLATELLGDLRRAAIQDLIKYNLWLFNE